MFSSSPSRSEAKLVEIRNFFVHIVPGAPMCTSSLCSSICGLHFVRYSLDGF
uniref:Uncharacterized protein n=1 Tax=Arundo donax TaxID=35708 RepID=A0A0A9FVP3_ARUDO